MKRSRQIQIESAKILVSENGLAWTVLFVLRLVTRYRLPVFDRLMRRLERAKSLPGTTSVSGSRAVWESYEWDKLGEEWTESADWKASLIDDVLVPNLPRDGVILEIGPGAGRWTEVLQAQAREVVIVDFSSTCIEACRQRFAGYPNITYHVNDGATLTAVADSSVDGVWSFDVFVHLDAATTESYISEIRRVLRPGAKALIHSGKGGGTFGGWRSRMTSAQMREIVDRQDLEWVAEIDSWGPRGEHGLQYVDAIYVFEKRPPSAD